MSSQTLSDQGRFVSRLTRDTVALILAGVYVFRARRMAKMNSVTDELSGKK